MQIDDIEHEKIRIKIEGMKAAQDASFFLINLALEDIKKEVSATLGEAKYTNGRVTQLESDYAVIRTLRTNKWLLLLLTIGIFKIFEIIDINWIFTKLISLF
jgi:hypothetical protein